MPKKTKMRPIDFRELEKAKRMEEVKRLEEIRTKIEFEKKYSESPDKTDSKKKSSAKMAGLKSLCSLNNNEQIMISFGRGNKAIIEKRIDADGKVYQIAEEKAFDAFPEKNQFVINGRVRGTADNPRENLKKPVGQDMIRAKAMLEDLYFGTTFEDNIHIQLIYNILDIKKILAVHTNNIVYTLNNIRRTAKSDRDDIIGRAYFDLSESYEHFKDNNKNYKLFKEFTELDQLSYFGNAFYRKTTQEEKMNFKPIIEGQEAPEYILKNEKDIYYILAMMNELRQVCVHHTETGDAANENNRRHSNIYNFECALTDEEKKTLDTLYGAKLNDLANFEKYNSKCNFRIIFDSLGINDTEAEKKAVKDFYNFTVRKIYKNIGFSIKTLREMVIDLYDDSIKSIDYDSVRQKINLILDFIIWNYYENNPGVQVKLISLLRTAEKNKDKQFIYFKEAKAILPEIKNNISALLEDLNAVKSQKSKKNTNENGIFSLTDKEKKTVESAIQEVSLSKNVSYFSKLIYLITLFLDGKEINDLLTTLINKLDNIASIESIIKKEFGKVKFVDEFSFFDSDKFLVEEYDKSIDKLIDKSIIVSELADINSFARMSIPVVIKKATYKEAAYLLGTDLSDEELERYIENNITNKELLKKLSDGKPKTGTHNFIINNVIESRSFKYLVRYTDPQKIKPVAENKAIVRFVLGRIPEAQIDRYYFSCTNNKSDKLAEKIEYLTNLICQMSFDYAIDVDQKANQKDPKKQLKRTVVSLYLNVLYQVAKNLIYVNSRYLIAFHSLERDMSLYGLNDDNRLALATLFKNNGYLNKHATEYLEVDIGNADLWAINKYRNEIAHINALRDAGKYIKNISSIASYFELYHYIMQHSIAEFYRNGEKNGYIYKKTVDGKTKPVNYLKSENKEIEMNPKTEEYICAVENYGSYVKDFIKALNAPFGYNLARFKNLSIDVLFDKDDTRERKKVKIED